MKKLIIGLAMFVSMLFVSQVDVKASADSISTTTNRVNDDVTVYVKNSSNTKNSKVKVEIKRNGKVVETKNVKVKADKTTKFKFETDEDGEYEVKYTVDKKSSKTPKLNKKTTEKNDKKTDKKTKK